MARMTRIKADKKFLFFAQTFAEARTK